VVLARVFNGLTLLLGIGLAAFSGLYAGLLFSLPGSNGSDLGMGLGGIVAVVGGTVALTLLLYLPPLIGLGRGRAWLWVWQLVTIGFSVIGGCIGVLSIGPILIIPAVILLIFWIKPEVRDYCSLPG